MSTKKRGWNAQEFADAGRKTEDYWEDGHGNETDEDGNIMLPEIVGEEWFMEWRKEGQEIAVEETERQWRLGVWVQKAEMMKEVAAETRDQRFKHAVYKAAAGILGISPRTAKGYAYVVRNVPEALKNEFAVSFAHFKLVAPFASDIAKQRRYLAEMVASGLNVTESRERINFLEGPKVEDKSVADRKAARIGWHASKLTGLLDSGGLPSTGSAALVFQLEDTRSAIAEAIENVDPGASVQTDAELCTVGSKSTRPSSSRKFPSKPGPPQRA